MSPDVRRWLDYTTSYGASEGAPSSSAIAWLPVEGKPRDETAGLHHLIGLFALLVAVRDRRARLPLALVFPYLLLAFVVSAPLRYWAPLFLGLAMIEGRALSLTRRTVATAATALLIFPSILTVTVSPWSALSLKYIGGELSSEEFAGRLVPGFAATRFIAAQPPGGTVMALDFPAPYYFDRPWIAEGLLNDPPLALWLSHGAGAERLRSELARRDVRYLVVTPGYGGGEAHTLLPLARNRRELEELARFRSRLRLIYRRDGVDVFAVPTGTDPAQ